MDVGGKWGATSTINLALMRDIDNGIVNIIYEGTDTRFDLIEVSPNTYEGSYGTSATISVSLTFTSPTTYIATETIAHESDCEVVMEWEGARQ